MIEIFDMDTSPRFYCDLPGFEIAEKPKVAAGLGCAIHGDAELMLNTAYADGERLEKPEAV